MTKSTRKPRDRNWSHDETLFLAEEKRRNGEDGRLLWEKIAQAVTNRFPERSARSAEACENRWDNLVRVYTHISKQSGRLEPKLPTAYRRDWCIIVKEVCDRKKNREQHTASTSGECLVIGNDGRTLEKVAKALRIQHAASTSGKSMAIENDGRPLENVARAGNIQHAASTSGESSEQQSGLEIGPDIGKEIAHVIGPEFWQGSEQVIEPEFRQVLGPQFRQVIGPEFNLVTGPKFWEEIDQALKQEQANEHESEQEVGQHFGPEAEQEAEQIKRATVYVPNIVESRSPSHKRQFIIAGENAFSVSGLPPLTSDESNLLQSFMSQSMPTRKISRSSSASNKEGDAEQRNHPKT